MPLTNRSYQHPHDFERLTRFLSHLRTDVQHTHYLHSGDLTWQMFHMLSDYPPADLIQIWEDTHGDILGFVLLFPPYGGFELQLRPQERGTALEAELLHWAEQHLPASLRRSTLVNNNDTARLSLLSEHGYGFIRRLRDRNVRRRKLMRCNSRALLPFHATCGRARICPHRRMALSRTAAARFTSADARSARFYGAICA
jgi:hypothetical protein